MAWCYWNQGNYSKSEELRRKAAQINLTFYTGFSIKEEEREVFTRRAESLAESIKKDPADDRSTGFLATLYGEIGRHDVAEEYYRKANAIRSAYFNPVTNENYQRLKEILDKRHIRLVSVQYPVRSVESLKKMFTDKEGIVFVDNERVFKDALRKMRYSEIFIDVFAGDFGHCTDKGNRILAENIANTILKEVFGK